MTGRWQTSPSAAMNAAGNYVLAWTVCGGSDHWDIYARRYSASGEAVGEAFRASSVNGQSAAVAMDNAGNFVVTWVSYGRGWGFEVFAQRFSAAGEKLAGEFRVNTYTRDNQVSPDVAMDANGVFVISWASEKQDGGHQGIYAQRYSPTGDPVGGEFLVNTTASEDQELPAIAMDPAGDFVIAWNTCGGGVFARRYTSAGDAQGSEFRVDPALAGSTRFVDVTMSDDGDFVVAWTVYDTSRPAGSDIYVRPFDATGRPRGDAFRVNDWVPFRQENPSVAMDDSGRFIVAWESEHEAGYPWAVFAKCFDANSVAEEGEFRVSSSPGGQFSGQLAMNNRGDFVAAWDSRDIKGQNTGIRAQQYRWASPLPACVSGVLWQDSNADGLRNPTEPGIDGTQVRLIRDDTGHVISTATAAGGLYQLDTLHPGVRYRLELVGVPSGIRQQSPAAAASDSWSLALNVAGAAVVVMPPGTVATALSIGDNAEVFGSAKPGSPLRLKWLSIGGAATLDLNGSDLVVECAPDTCESALFQITKLIAQARNATLIPWQGRGITSSTVAGSASLMGLGTVSQLTTGGSILVRCTWNGDGNLDGVVNADDYYLIDSGYLLQEVGWHHGDFNYDGVVNADDYFLIDSAFIGQTCLFSASNRVLEAENAGFARRDRPPQSPRRPQMAFFA